MILSCVVKLKSPVVIKIDQILFPPKYQVFFLWPAYKYPEKRTQFSINNKDNSQFNIIITIILWTPLLKVFLARNLWQWLLNQECLLNKYEY